MTATRLTHREEQIRTLVADGLTNDDIATRLKISRKTVESHLRMLFRKLGISRREQVSLGDLVPVPDPHAFGATSVGKLRELEEQLLSYETAIGRITDRQTPLFTERVEIDVVVGVSAADDAVVERRWTQPQPYLVHRLIRPILPVDPAVPLSDDDLRVACEVPGLDVGVEVQAILDRKRRHRLLMTFQPGLQDETEWVLRYRAPGMWDPLRQHGDDRMTWMPGVFDQARPATSISAVTVRFLFPPATTSADVAEVHGLGVTGTEPNPDGSVTVVWTDSRPGSGHYDWQLKMTQEQ